MNDTYIRNLNLIINDANSIETDSSGSVLINIKLKQQHIDTLNIFDSSGFTICTNILLEDNTRIDLSKLAVGSSVLLNLSPHYMKKELGFAFYFTFNEFIEKNNTKLQIANYFILDKKISSIQAENNNFISTYNLILELQNIFKDIADDVDEGIQNKIYTFFDTKKIKITSSFTLEDIEYIIENCPNFGFNVKKLFDDLELASQKQIRIIFFKKALESTFKDKSLTLSIILRNLKNIFEEYEAHYRAYINSLEPEKIKYEFEEEHNKFLKELNSILAEVHNKVIFIPIAFIFGASQLTSGSFAKGVMIVSGMLIFSLFISLFLDTHNKVLEILEENISDKKNFYQKENPSLFEKFKSKIVGIENLTKSIKTRIIMTKYSNWVLTLIVVIVFYYLNK